MHGVSSSVKEYTIQGGEGELNRAFLGGPVALMCPISIGQEINQDIEIA